VVTDSFLADALSSAQDCAMPAIRIVPIPAKTWYTARNQEPRMKEVAAAAFDAIIDALKDSQKGQWDTQVHRGDVRGCV